MEIKRTEKASRISETQNSETNSASSKKVSTFSTSDSFENASANQSMFSAPKSESPLTRVSESLEKQFDAARLEQSLIGNSSPQPVSRANDKQAEFTKAHSEFQQTVKARRQEALDQVLDNALDDLRNGNSPFLGGEYSPIFPDPLSTINFPRDESSQPERKVTSEKGSKRNIFDDSLGFHKAKPTSSVEDEQVRNVKNHSEALESSSPEPTSRANDKQAEFTEAMSKFKRTQEEAEAKRRS